MSIEEKFQANVIVHPSFLHTLEKHLQSIERAQKAYQKVVKVNVLLSYCNSTSAKKTFIELIDSFHNLNVSYYVEKERFTCAKARNYLFKISSSEWSIFFDADVLVDRSYFQNLKRVIDTIDQRKVKAIAGGMGTWGTTPEGYCEYLMDMYAYYGKAEGISINSVDLNNYAAEYSEKIPNYDLFTGRPTYYLQGYNQIVHRDMYLNYGGYDSDYFGAEDREMAGKIVSKGYEIKLFPELLVYHYFNFSIADIARRKYGHGYYSAKFRSKYKYLKHIRYAGGLSKWIKYFFSLFYPPRTFRQFPGYLYYLFAFWTYLAGSVSFRLELTTGIRLFCIHDISVPGRNISRLSRIGTIIPSFDYSNYSFTRKKDD